MKNISTHRFGGCFFYAFFALSLALFMFILGCFLVRANSKTETKTVSVQVPTVCAQAPLGDLVNMQEAASVMAAPDGESAYITMQDGTGYYLELGGYDK